MKFYIILPCFDHFLAQEIIFLHLDEWCISKIRACRNKLYVNISMNDFHLIQSVCGKIISVNQYKQMVSPLIYNHVFLLRVELTKSGRSNRLSYRD